MLGSSRIIDFFYLIKYNKNDCNWGVIFLTLSGWILEGEKCPFIISPLDGTIMKVNIRVKGKLVLQSVNCKYLDSAPGSFESPFELY